MSERAKEIAAAIITDVWPAAMHAYFIGSEFHESMERAVEKHMLRPHQVRDRDGDVWEHRSDGLYTVHKKYTGETIKEISESFGPLTTIQGEPLPDIGEVAKLKERIAEKEKLMIAQEIEHDKIMHAAIAESDRQRERIAELEKQLAAAKSDQAKPQPEPIWQRINDSEWIFGVPVRGIIWQPIAKVIDGCDFFWHLIDLSQKGHHQHFRDAIESATVAAEKVMGIS